MRKHLKLDQAEVKSFLPHWLGVTCLRQSWAQPLLGLSTRDDDVWLSYGETADCRFWNPASRRETAVVFAALAELHGKDLWVGDIAQSVRITHRGHARLTALGSHWGRFDPWGSHPSAASRPDVRLPWRQARDLTQAAQLVAGHAGPSVRETVEIGTALGWSADEFADYFDRLEDIAA